MSDGSPASPRTETLTGLVERVIYHNPENGFCVLRIKVRGHKALETLIGHAPSVTRRGSARDRARQRRSSSSRWRPMQPSIPSRLTLSRRAAQRTPGSDTSPTTKLRIPWHPGLPGDTDSPIHCPDSPASSAISVREAREAVWRGLTGRGTAACNIVPLPRSDRL